MSVEVSMKSIEPAAVVREHLRPGERLLWTGQPRQGLRWSGAEAVSIGAGIGMATLISGGGLAAVAAPIGVAVLIGRLLVDAHVRRRTYYALSSERALMVTTFRGRRVQSVSFQSLTAFLNRLAQAPNVGGRISQEADLPICEQVEDMRPVIESLVNGEPAAR
jgi:hypothetical protein